MSTRPDMSILPSVEDIERAARFVMDLELRDATDLMSRMDGSDCLRAYLAASIDTIKQTKTRAAGIIIARAFAQGILAERNRAERMQHVAESLEKFATGDEAEEAGRAEHKRVTEEE